MGHLHLLGRVLPPCATAIPTTPASLAVRNAMPGVPLVCLWTSTWRIEHAILAPALFPFFTKVLRDRGLLSFDEPFSACSLQGMVPGHQPTRTRRPANNVAPADVGDPADPPADRD